MTRVVAVSMFKDEADIAEGVVRHMADEVNNLIIADNGSTDGTREILHRLAKTLPLAVLDDPDPAYFQSRKMTALADLAAERFGGRNLWIVPFDADELWMGADRVGAVLAQARGNVATAALYNHLATALDLPDPDPFRSLVWRQAAPATMPKVAFKWEPGAVIGQGNHSVTLPSGNVAEPLLQIRHFPARSAEQWTRKGINGAAAVRAANLPRTEGAHWWAYGEHVDREGPGVLAEIFREHWWYRSPADARPPLVRDPAPYMRWQQLGGEA